MTSQPLATTHTLLRAEGFSCPSCVGKIEKSLGRLDGVEAVTVSFATGRIEVDHDPRLTNEAELVTAVAKAGYRARVAAY
ncbi:heavy-metal-associated domain-containing protein [Nocardioides pacificus]